MTGFVEERHQDCGHSTDWAMQGVRELATLLSQSDMLPREQPSRDDMSGAFHSAICSRDVSRATEIGKLSGNWPALAMRAIALLDEAWQEDALSIGEIAECYWALRRTLDELIANPFLTKEKSLSIGTAVVYIPGSEQHTFGPQMLVDKVNRLGWDAQLWHGLSSVSLMDQLGSTYVDVLGISVGTDIRLDGLADLLTDVRQHSMNPDIKIIIGGNAICGTSDRYRFLGADWVATTAVETQHFFEHIWSDLKRREGRFNG